MSLFSLSLSLIKFKTNNNRHFLNYGDKKIINKEKSENLLNFVASRTLRKTSVFKNCSSGI